MRKRIGWVLGVLAVLLVAGPALAQYEPGTNHSDGATRTVIGGSLDVESGGDLDIESGGALKIAGTAVTASAAELNFVDASVADGTYDFTRPDAGTVTITVSDDDAAAQFALGSTTITDIQLLTDGVTGDLLGSETFKVTATTTATATFVGADAASPADTLLDTTGAGTITVGSVDVTSIPVITDGGTVTIDGYVQADAGPFVTLASGALTINTIHLATAAADYDIPATACDASADIGTWITVIVRDISEVISITVDDTSNIMHVTGVALGADDELDSEGAATGDGDHVTLVCMAVDNWYATATAGVWADGGGAD